MTRRPSTGASTTPMACRICPPKSRAVSSQRGARRTRNLAAIQERITADEDGYPDGLVDPSVRDRRYLLALVRDQAATLDAVKALADYVETLTDGDRHYAALIRDALISKDGA